MKTKIVYTTLLLLMFTGFVMSCSDDESIKIYMPAASKVVSATFDVDATIHYTATIVGADYPTSSMSTGSDVTVEFKVDADKVATYNTAMATNYTILPSENFTFDATGTIAKGESSTAPLNLTIKNGDLLDPFSSYLLPIAIDKVNGGSTSDIQQTTYFILTRSPSLENLPAFDRSEWSIAAKSTEEPGEGGGNGLAIAAIDGNLGSFWHTQWADSEPPPPHYITIDMGEEAILHGVSIVDRNLGDWAHGQPKAVKISVSKDGVTFEDNGSFSLAMSNPQAEIRFFLPTFKSARYLKVTVLSTWGDTKSSSIAEIYAL